MRWHLPPANARPSLALLCFIAAGIASSRGGGILFTAAAIGSGFWFALSGPRKHLLLIPAVLACGWVAGQVSIGREQSLLTASLPDEVESLAVVALTDSRPAAFGGSWLVGRPIRVTTAAGERAWNGPNLLIQVQEEVTVAWAETVRVSGRLREAGGFAGGLLRGHGRTGPARANIGPRPSLGRGWKCDPQPGIGQARRRSSAGSAYCRLSRRRDLPTTRSRSGGDEASGHISFRRRLRCQRRWLPPSLVAASRTRRRRRPPPRLGGIGRPCPLHRRHPLGTIGGEGGSDGGGGPRQPSSRLGDRRLDGAGRRCLAGFARRAGVGLRSWLSALAGRYRRDHGWTRSPSGTTSARDPKDLVGDPRRPNGRHPHTS